MTDAPEAPDLPEATCAHCRAPVVAVVMRTSGDVELLDEAYSSGLVVLVRGNGMVASRAYTKHERTCGARRRRKRRRDEAA